MLSKWSDVLHYAAGAVAGYLVHFIPLLSLFLILIFTCYQALEEEEAVEKLGDCVEFLLGFLVGLTAVSAARQLGHIIRFLLSLADWL